MKSTTRTSFLSRARLEFYKLKMKRKEYSIIRSVLTAVLTQITLQLKPGQSAFSIYKSLIKKYRFTISEKLPTQKNIFLNHYVDYRKRPWNFEIEAVGGKKTENYPEKDGFLTVIAVMEYGVYSVSLVQP